MTLQQELFLTLRRTRLKVFESLKIETEGKQKPRIDHVAIGWLRLKMFSRTLSVDVNSDINFW